MRFAPVTEVGSHLHKLAIPHTWPGTRYPARMSDAARTLYLVCYDIACPKRWRQVYRYLLGFRVGGQKSFLECWLTEAELREVRRTLTESIDPGEDRVHIFQLDPRMALEGLGRASAPVTSPVFIL